MLFLSRFLFLAILIFVISPTPLLADQRSENLIFFDDFNTKKLNPRKWQIIIGDGCPDLCGFGNKELQTYTNHTKNLRATNGYLVIEAHKEPDKNSSFTSAKITTLPTGGWKYGTFSIRAKISHGKGTWPAIWMMPIKEIYGPWPNSGEIDIMENVGFEPGIIHGSVHSAKMNGMLNNNRTGKISVPDASTEFHVYSVKWSKDKIIWSVDGRPYYTISRKLKFDNVDWPFDQPFYLILNLAVGGTWGGQQGIDEGSFPAQMVVDWVKVSKD